MKKIYLIFAIILIALSCEKQPIEGPEMPIQPDVLVNYIYTYLCPSCDYQKTCNCGEGECWNFPTLCSSCGHSIGTEDKWRYRCDMK
jgi:hypothetical protein